MLHCVRCRCDEIDELPVNTIINGDCLEIIKTLPSESIDLIATDPPYGISFMNEKWDVFNETTNSCASGRSTESMRDFFVPRWKECLRVLKPGGFAFVMCAPRADVFSKQVSCLAEAGFNVGFTPIFWTFAAGFPKSANISKSIDRKFGMEREVVGKYISPRQVERKTFRNEFPLGDYGQSKTSVCYGKYAGKKERFNITAPASESARTLDGSYAGFQPKPAVEIIIVAMKPLSEKTYAEQAMKNRKGITWLSDVRIPYQQQETPNVGGRPKHGRGEKYGFKPLGETAEVNMAGRFPANLLVSDDVLNDGVSGKSIGHAPNIKTTGFGKFGGGTSERVDYKEDSYIRDEGSFSRYFDLDAWFGERMKKLPESVQKVFPFLIVPKASKSERDRGCEGMMKTIGHNRFDQCEKCGGYIFTYTDRPSKCKCETPKRKDNTVKGNFHATVKPVRLFLYLTTLGSREGDIVLDPFLGSGTTAIACRMLNRRYVGIETEKDYVEIAEKRLSAIPVSIESFAEDKKSD